VLRKTGLGKTASDAGELAFNALLVLIALSWFRRLPFTRFQIPYQLWRFSHRVMGALFASSSSTCRPGRIRRLPCF